MQASERRCVHGWRVLFLVAVVTVGCGSPADDAESPSPPAGTVGGANQPTAPDFTLTDLSGAPLR
ncbi:MAG: hypothetical protein ABGY41_13785, partial [Candidatus Poribacteria bacterium]